MSVTPRGELGSWSPPWGRGETVSQVRWWWWCRLRFRKPPCPAAAAAAAAQGRQGGGCSELGGAAGVTLQQPHNGRITLRALDELFQGQFAWGGKTGESKMNTPSRREPRTSQAQDWLRQTRDQGPYLTHTCAWHGTPRSPTFYGIP